MRPDPAPEPRSYPGTRNCRGNPLTHILSGPMDTPASTPGTPPPSDVTQTFLRWRQGDADALNALLPLVYDEMRRLAAGYLSHERSGHTLQPTALAHEAYLRLLDQRSVSWQNRAHFMGLAAQAMRRILTDHARRRIALKRGGDAVRVELTEVEDSVAAAAPQEAAAIDLDEALDRLARLDERQSRVVELRYYGGLSIEETAEVLAVSPATVRRDWTVARAWLHRELEGRTP
ncbi:MAG TPA: sigma-70 family RNA polymerase sigma factor [Candidatus Eisenbacteria bacterium]|nr:sigma-70 family RNA polymerase sigma factor [Candidatus Eisenbacteria bacterium]